MFYKLDVIQKLIEPKNSNATVTIASGVEFCNKPEFWRYIKSLKNVDADHYVLTHEINISQRLNLEFNNCVVIDVDRYPVFSRFKSNNFFIVRSAVYAMFLDRLKEFGYKLVAVTDSKDIIFQANIFDVIDYTILTSEGISHKDSPWNMGDQVLFHKSIKPQCKEEVGDVIDLSEKSVLNGGVVLGSPNELVNIMLLLNDIGFCCKDNSNFTDQAILNHCYYSGRIDCKIADPRHDNICITGEAIKENFMKEHFLFEDNMFLTKDGKKYYIVHQWDRTQYRDTLLNG